MSSTQEYDPYETARYCLNCLKPRSDRSEWIRVGMACRSVGNDLLGDWLAWSAAAPNYQEREARRQWSSFKPDGGITLGTLVDMAKKDGAVWPPPDTSKSPSRRPPPPLTSIPDPAPPPTRQSRGAKSELVAVYPYMPGYVRLRYEMPDGSKEVVPWSWNAATSKWGWGEPVRADGELLPLYRAGDVQALPELHTVYVVEGEKCADYLAMQLGDPAVAVVTSGGGANHTAAGKHDWKVLADRDVVILPDNDDGGSSYADWVAKRLRGVAKSVTKAPPFDLGQKADVVDWLEKHDAATPQQLRQMLADHVAQAKPEPFPGDFTAILSAVVDGLSATHARGWLGLRMSVFKTLDEKLCGLRGLMVLGAAPGIGKTQLTLQLGLDVLQDKSVGLVYLSLEMSTLELGTRMLSMASNLRYRKLRLGDQALKPHDAGDSLEAEPGEGLKLQKDDRIALGNGLRQLEALAPRIRIYGSTDVGPLESIHDDPAGWYAPMAKMIEDAKRRMGVARALVVVDNLQAITVTPAGGRPWASDMDRDRVVIEGLTRLQHDTADAVMVVSEVTKDKFDGTSTMAAILGTGRNAYRADAVMLLKRRNAEGGDDRQVDLIVDKGRDGMKRGRVALEWDEHFMRLSEVDGQ